MRRWREAVAFFIFIKNYMQKVLMINGSPRIGGNTSIALREMENIFKENDVEVETVQIGNKDIRISGYQDIRISEDVLPVIPVRQKESVFLMML